MKFILILIYSFVSLVFLVCFVFPSFSQNQYKEGKLDRTDVSLHFRIFGNKGPWLIILGGGPGSEVNYMQPIADSLSKFYQCIMLEQRGTGRSVLKKYDTSTINMGLYVEDIEHLRKYLKTDKIILVGNSWGSLLSFIYGSKYPQHTKSIISIGSPIFTNEYAEIFNDNLRSRLCPDDIAKRDEWRHKLKDSATFVLANFERDKASMPAYFFDRKIGLNAALLLKPTDFNYYVFPAFFKSHPQFDVRAGLKKIAAPVLFVHGRQDLSPESNIIEAHQLMKQSQIKFIERCGHTPWEEKPTETWNIVYAFLDQYNHFQ